MKAFIIYMLLGVNTSSEILVVRCYPHSKKKATSQNAGFHDWVEEISSCFYSNS